MAMMGENALTYVLTLLKTKFAGKVDKVEGKSLSTNDYTTADKSKLAGIAAGANAYVHPAYPAKGAGLYKVTVDATGHVSAVAAVTKGDITALGIPGQDTNTTYSDMAGATSGAAGTHGLVPAPAAGQQIKYLRGDGTWQTPPDTNTTYGDATTSAHGLMTADMVTKLNGIAAGANAYVHPAYAAKSSGLYKITVDATGHISAVVEVTKADITALGIPGQDTNTTYNAATASAAGLMSAADKGKLDAFGAASGYATTSYVAQQVAAAGHLKKQIVTSLPAVSGADANTIYMVAKTGASGGNAYDEYMVISGAWEKIGDTQTIINEMTNAEVDSIFNGVFA